MKTALAVLLSLTELIALSSCATSTSGGRWQKGTTTIQVSGAPGAGLTGFVVHHGRRVEFTNAVPFTITQAGLSEAEIRKVNPAETIGVRARYDGDMHLDFLTTAGPGVPGVRVKTESGFSLENLNTGP